MTRIKICGLTNLEDALAAVEFGADAIGFVLAKSPRQISPAEASEIAAQLPPYIARVGVFVGGSKKAIEEIYHSVKLTEVQIYFEENNGAESPTSMSIPYLRSLRVKDDDVLYQISRLGLDQFHLDGFDPSRMGGTGQQFDWEIAARAAKIGRLTLAGGLTPENIVAALEQVRPYAVDLSSGVELSPGKKDHDKMKSFIQKVRKWDSRTS